MPTYDYHCNDCGNEEEVFQKITDEPLTICPKCKKAAFQRGPGGGIGLSFKGKGYYITDYGPLKTEPSDDKPSSCCPCGKDKPSCTNKD